MTGDSPCPRDGSPPPPSAAPDLDGLRPASLPGFALGELLGAGGFSVVWAARRLEDGAAAAIKIGRRDEPVLHARFRDEADALRRIGPPHVPALHGSGRLEDGRPYLALERLTGSTLAAELAAQEAPLAPATACAIGEAILGALSAAHDRGVIHRDLKPENIVLAGPALSDGHVQAKILDFGLTRRLAGTGSDSLAGALSIVGTPMYMAPEQIRGDRSIDARADLYAFGVVLYELLALRPPFVGDARSIEHGHLTLRPPRPSAFAEVPQALEEIVLRCLAKDPDRRPRSAEALRSLLAEAGRSAHSAMSGGPRHAAAADGAVAPGGKLLREGRQPVVILVVDVERPATPVAPIVADRRGFLVRQRGRRYVAVFSGMTTDAPAHAALDAARVLIEHHGARAALHLAPVVLRWREQGAPSVFGAPVDRPETWLPEAPWAGLSLSEEVCRALPSAMAPTAELSSNAARPRGAPGALPLLGRSAEIEAITASFTAVLAEESPGLFTLIGAPGLGKSRLADSAAAMARAACPEATILELAASPAASALGAATKALLAAALLAPVEPPPDPRRFCAARLGEALGVEVAPAVCRALGWPGEGALNEDTAALRSGVTRAIAEGLRRLARGGPVAVVLDDAHAADDAALDALEFASLLGAGLSLWVFVAARPSFEQARPSWGARTERRSRATLGPLDAAAAAELAARMLEPVEYPPAAVGQRLAAWSGGNPLCLSELVLALKRAGVVQQREITGSFYVATAELDKIPASPAWQWLAARQLEGMSPELAAFARLSAVLGDDLERGAIEAVQTALDRGGRAGAPVDVGFGLASLTRSGILVAGGGERCSFQNVLLRDALRAGLDDAERAEIHRAALAYYRARASSAAPSPELLAALAGHATAGGALEEAADAHLSLGDRAQTEHNHVEADQRYTAALALAAEGDLLRRTRALAGRGKSRYFLWRMNEAVSDLAEARALAASLRDRELSARVLLEEATALDWRRELDASARRVGEAAAILEVIDAPHLRGRLLVAEGRTALRRMTELRQGSAEAIVALLGRGITASAASGDSESRVIGLLLLPTALRLAGREGDVEARFDEVIALTAAAGDRNHLCAAYSNRSQFQRQPERAVDDLERAIVLAREIGNPWLERGAAYNVAERLHLGGRTDEALSLGRRARLLEERFVENPLPSSSLLLARILLLSGAYEEAGRHVAWVASRCPPPRAPHLRYGFYQLARLVLAELLPGAPPADETWDTALQLAGEDRNLEVPERLEMLYWRARLALRGERQAEATRCLELGQPLFGGSPFWRARVEALFAPEPAVDPRTGHG